MTKKIRLWICKCCGNYRIRNKNESNWHDAPRCSNCNKDMEVGRKYPKRKECKHIKAIKKVRVESDKYYSRLRNDGGKVLKISKNTKDLWKKVDKAKTRISLIKYTKLWLISLKEDMKDDNEKHWKKKFNFSNGEISLSRGGISSIPQVEIVPIIYGATGIYKRAFMQGVHQIQIENRKDISLIKSTLLHEVLHWLDDRAEVPSIHDSYFRIRLKLLGNHFKIKGLEVDDLK